MEAERAGIERLSRQAFLLRRAGTARVPAPQPVPCRLRTDRDPRSDTETAGGAGFPRFGSKPW